MTRPRARAALRAEMILALYAEEGLTYAEIATRAGVTRQRVHQVIKEALAEATDRRQEFAQFALERELLLCESMMREAAEIIRRKCDECAGDEQRRQRCGDCESSGYFYSPYDRLAAFDRHARAQERRIKLLAPVISAAPQPAGDRDFYADLEKLTDAELVREIEMLRIPVSDKPAARGRPLDDDQEDYASP